MEEEKLNKKPHKKTGKIYKNTELISLTASGIEQVSDNEYIKITPFTESLGKSPPHVDTIKGKLTECFLWADILKKYDIEFFLDKEGFVKGFIKKQIDKESIENRLKVLENLMANKK
jgi:hypothetical protein